MRPTRGVVARTSKVIDTVDGWHDGRCQYSNTGDEELRPPGPATFIANSPLVASFIEMRGRHARFERDVLTQVEFVCDVVDVTQGLGLRREVFAPVPLLQQLLGK